VVADVAQSLGGLGRCIVDVIQHPVLGDGGAAQKDGGCKNKQQLKNPAHVYFLQLIGMEFKHKLRFCGCVIRTPSFYGGGREQLMVQLDSAAIVKKINKRNKWKCLPR